MTVFRTLSKSRWGAHRWIAFAAASWALIFGIFHVLWASGRYVGLDAEQARIAFARPWFLVYDLVVAAMCVIAVPVALALGMPWGRRVSRRVLGFLAWTGTILLGLRSCASLIQTGYLMAVGRFSLRDFGIWEPWFYLGAFLFAVSTWQYSKRQPGRP
ncbi:MAG: DUF3995 domain-containing protein [Longimicrobiales bacterium]